jgi:threonine dehydrogenase-like Zn-dependent dehydrogenase
MGLLHLLVLRAALPGCSVIVVDPVAERRTLAEKLGARNTVMPGNAALRRSGPPPAGSALMPYSILWAELKP